MKLLDRIAIMLNRDRMHITIPPRLVVHLKPMVVVNMRYNTGLPTGSHDRRPIQPASWTATVDTSTLPAEFRGEMPLSIEASGFARAQAITGIERQLRNWGIRYTLEVRG